MVDIHVSVILLFDIHNVSKFVRVTNRITKRAKIEREPSRVPVKIFMKAQKKRKNRKKLKATVSYGDHIIFFHKLERV